MPLNGGQSEKINEDPDAYNRADKLSATLTLKEMTSLTPEEILHRLYWEENVRVYDKKEILFHCHCSVASFESILHSLGKEEVYRLLQNNGKITITCQFCGRNFTFMQQDIERIFSTSSKKLN